MKRHLPLAAAALALGSAACRDYLTSGETSRNPNVVNTVVANNFFAGTQLALWNELGGDMSRESSILAQHLTGVLQQYEATNQYDISDQTTNGFHQGLYLQGGLGDIRNLQSTVRAQHDSLYLGIAQVQEAWLMGEGADLFGDLVYSHALTNESNPPLDKQMTVYAHVEALLDTAIVNMAATGPTNIGPQSYDLAYGGDPVKWTRLAHTLKARFYMHQIHAPGVLPDTLSARALAQTQLGLQAGDDYKAQFSGAALAQNYWYNFNVTGGRAGYYKPSQTLIDTIIARSEGPVLIPRYFNADTSNLSDTLAAANAPQTFASHVENLLLAAEAAYRTGDQATARADLIAARAAERIANPSANVPASGLPLLHAILVEKWISDFALGTEAWTDYRRTCTPNLAPTITGGKIPGRFFYDANEQQTNTNIPPAGQGANGAYAQAQPPLATSDGTGTPCLAQ